MSFAGNDPVYTNVLVDLQILPNELDFSIRILDQRRETLLYRLNLLRNGTKNALFQSVKLIKAAPSADLAKTNENTTHSFEVKVLIATKDQYESTQLYTEGLHRFGLAWRPTSSLTSSKIVRKEITHQFQRGQKVHRQAGYPELA